MGVVGIYCGIADEAVINDEVARRHGELPGIHAVSFGHIEAKFKVKIRQLLWEAMGEAELVRKNEIFIVHEGKGKTMLLSHLAAVLRQLRAEDDELATLLKNLRVDMLQSIQLCDAVRSPEAAEEVENNGAIANELRRAGRISFSIEQVKIGEMIASADCLLM